MKKLELKDIAGYLSYGLKCLDIENIAEVIYEFSTNSADGINFVNAGKYTISQLKPILRPMSDLTKEIEVNGDKFVPIERMKYLQLISPFYNIGDVLGGQIIDSLFTSSRYGGEFMIIDFLNSLHFDYRGLIGQGLAIDINTLKL